MLIRDARPDDEPEWRRLWALYNTFYEAELPEAVTAATWARILDPAFPIVARVAEGEDGLIGFTNSVLHPTTWTLTPACYLEDLYVDAAVRGKGTGRALIEDLLALCKARDWSRLYWHTAETNATARRLYDTFGTADGFVRYRLPIGG